MAGRNNERIVLTVSGLVQSGDEEGPGDGVRIISGSRMNGRDIVSFIFELSRDLLAKVFEYVRMKEGTKKIGEISIEAGSAKIRVTDFSEENLDQIFTEIRRTVDQINNDPTA